MDNIDSKSEYKVKNKSTRTLLTIIALLLIVMIGGAIWFGIMLQNRDRTIQSERTARQQAEIDLEQSIMNNDFEQLNREFEALEGQTIIVRNDSLQRDINEKYRIAKERMEKLQSEVESLKNERSRNRDEIKKLKRRNRDSARHPAQLCGASTTSTRKTRLCAAKTLK